MYTLISDIIFSPLNYINLSPPKNLYSDSDIYEIMKLQKVKSREYKNKKYFKYRVEFPEKIIKLSGFKEGDELIAEATKGEIKLRRK